MQKLPVVAVVGRPNVGKSTFFNKVTRKRISIVKNEAGVTRDRIFADADWCGYNFTMIDTGGLEPDSDDMMFKRIYEQAILAVDLADVIVFIADGKQGIVSDDYEIANVLRRSGKPVVLGVNKLDNYESELSYDFYNLDIGVPHCISCEHGLGLGDLLDEVVKHLKRTEKSESDAIRIAVVGKPNAGKSSLVNRILGYERVIVSDVPGTTRDAIDTPFEYNGKDYLIIDTAGMRRKRSIEPDTVERYSVVRAISAIRRADVVLVMFDAESGLTEQDVKIAGFVDEEGKPTVIVLNKWDAVEKDTHTIETFTKQLENDLAFMNYFASISISAKTGLRINKLLELSAEVLANSQKRITTGTLNDVIAQAVAANEPVAPRGQRVRIYYATQVGVSPPTFSVFVNKPEIVHFSYRRYLENCIRKAVDFSGTPIKINFVRSSKKE